jgi:hypothetical protein
MGKHFWTEKTQSSSEAEVDAGVERDEVRALEDGLTGQPPSVVTRSDV